MKIMDRPPFNRLYINSIINLAGSIVPIGITYFLTPYLLSAVGNYRYGIWATINSFCGYLLLMDFGMGGAIRRFIGQGIGLENEHQVRGVLSNAIWLYIIITSCAIGVGLYAVHDFLGRIAPHLVVSHEISATSELFVIFTGSFVLSQPFSGTLVAYQRFDLQVSARTWQLLLQTALILAAFEIARWRTLTAIAVSYLLASLFGLATVLIFVHRTCIPLNSLRRKIDSTLIKDMFSFSWMSSITGIGEILIANSGSVIIATTVGAEQVVRYAIPLSIALQIPRFVEVLTQVVGPEMARLGGCRDFENIRKTFYDLTVLVNCVCIPVLILSVIFAPEFFRLWIGPSGSDYWVVYDICAAACSFRAMQSTGYHTLMGAGQIVGQATATIVAAIIGIVAAYFYLSRGFDIIYGAIALLLPCAVKDVIMIPVIVCRQFEMRIYRLYLRGYVLPIALTTAVGCVFFIVKNQFQPLSMLGVMALGGIGIMTSALLNVVVLEKAMCGPLIRAVFRSNRVEHHA